MNWRHLIDAARLLAGQSDFTAQGRPRQAMLKRAVSAAYYAMFHALCRSNAAALIGRSSGASHSAAWTRTYRALEHRYAREQLRQVRSGMPLAVREFGRSFNILQENRHRADYDPEARFARSDVSNLIDRAETAIQGFLAADVAERRSLAAIVLLRSR